MHPGQRCDRSDVAGSVLEPESDDSFHCLDAFMIIGGDLSSR